MCSSAAPRRPVLSRAVAVAAALSLALLAGCGGGLSGTYLGAGEDKLEFRGDKVYVSIWPAPTLEGEYEVDGDRVLLQVAGQTLVLTHDGDKITGGPFGQTFTKAGRGRSQDRVADVSGTWHAEDGVDTVVLEFRGESRVELTLAGDQEVIAGEYRVEGEHVTIDVPGGAPIRLSRREGALEGTLMGFPLRFTRL